MARKSETGIEYFPMNSDIVHNPKVKLVVAEFGPKTTWALLLPLYCKIYREKGYWIDWNDEDIQLQFADDCKIEFATVKEFVKGCIRRSLFDKEVFDMFGILTSDRIQENYLTAKKRNLSIDFIEEFNAIGDDVNILFKNVNIIGLNVNIISKNVDVGTQKKKEKKKEKLEEEGDSADAAKPSPDEKILFNQFEDWIKKKAPRVNQLKSPITIQEYLKLRKAMSREVLKDILIQMHNYKPLLSKNISAYLTILNWKKRRDDDLGNITQPAGSSINEQLKQSVKN